MKRKGLFDFGFNDLNRDGNISPMEAAFGMQVMDEIFVSGEDGDSDECDDESEDFDDDDMDKEFESDDDFDD